jgi:hypothetical protein
VISVGAVFDANIGGWGFCVSPESCAPNQETYSSCATGYIAWAYTTQADQVAPYSNVSSFLDVFGPSHFAYTTDRGGGFKEDFGGTSAACPYIAGLAACIQSAAMDSTGAFLNPQEMKAKLVDYGDPVHYGAAGITKSRPNLFAMDIDGDGMASGWELDFFNSLTVSDGTLDNDNDELSDLGEYENKTDPTNADTDGDGFTDGQEVTAGTDPLDDNDFPEPIPVPALSHFGSILAAFFLFVIAAMKKKT